MSRARDIIDKIESLNFKKEKIVYFTYQDMLRGLLDEYHTINEANLNELAFNMSKLEDLIGGYSETMWVHLTLLLFAENCDQVRNHWLSEVLTILNKLAFLFRKTKNRNIPAKFYYSKIFDNYDSKGVCVSNSLEIINKKHGGVKLSCLDIDIIYKHVKSAFIILCDILGEKNKSREKITVSELEIVISQVKSIDN